MTRTSLNVLLIEGNQDEVSIMDKMLSTIGNSLTRINAHTPGDLLANLFSHPSDVIMCHAAQSGSVMSALHQLEHPLPVIILGTSGVPPLLESSSEFQIVHLAAPFSQNVIKAVLKLLVCFNPKCYHVNG
ncbi:hypothetical protein [Runella sp.]|uniref:hypothetical protein n=1 Tax=Runella sp. TaxID=1960881 RepID=UPI003D0EC54B